MKKETKTIIKAMQGKFPRIERLIEEKKFKDALAELRDIERTQKLDSSSSEFGQFCYLSASALHGLGNHQKALSKAKEAFHLLMHTHQDKQVAQVQYLSGVIYMALGKFGEARDELRDSLATYRRIDDDAGVISVLNRLASICFVRADYDDALQYLHRCLDACKKVGDESGETRVLSNLGSVYMLTGRWQVAKEYLELHIRSTRQRNDMGSLCKGLSTLGYLEHLTRNFERATALCREALKIAESSSYLRQVAICHEYLAEFALAQADCTSAKKHCLKAIEIGEEIAPEGDIISQSVRILAEIEIAEMHYDEALSCCERAMKVARSLDEKIEIAVIHRARGQIYTAKANKDMARQNFTESIRMLEHIGAKFELGKAYLETGKSDCFDDHDRLHYLRRAKDVFKELGSQYYEGLADSEIAELS